MFFLTSLDKHRYGLDTVSILYRYPIDTVSILYRYGIDTVSKILYRYNIDIVRVQYRYSIDTVWIQHQYSLRKTKDRVLLGSENRSTSASRVGKKKHRWLWRRKTEAQASFGVDPGSLQEDPGVILGVRGRSERVTGDRRRPKKKCSFPEV